MAEFIYRDHDHSYWLDGKQMPALSDLLRVLTEAHYSEIPDQMTVERARERGVEAHADIEAYLKGDLDQYASPYTEAYAEWARDSGFTATHVEFATYHRAFLYGTRIDLLGELKDGTKLLVDVKTGYRHESHPVQLGGQVIALHSQGDCPLDVARGNLYLLPKHKKAQYDYVCYTGADLEESQALATSFAIQYSRGPRFGLRRQWFTERSYE